MKKQIVFVWGWESKQNYRDYYDYIEKIDYDPFKQKIEIWARKLWKELWENFDVFVHDRPNKDFADYKAWKIVFEKILPFLENDLIFIGHSLGWTFLIKYFDETHDKELLKKVSKIILVAPAFKDSYDEVLWDFNFDKNLINLKKIEDKITIFASKDDFIVDFSDIEDYMRNLPKADYKIFEDKGHFLQEEFPELIDFLSK